MVQGQIFLKGRSSLMFLSFIITVRNYFSKLCYAFEEKKNFFCHHNFREKNHSKLSKNEPKNIP